jgi:hypothetical protein
MQKHRRRLGARGIYAQVVCLLGNAWIRLAADLVDTGPAAIDALVWASCRESRR